LEKINNNLDFTIKADELPFCYVPDIRALYFRRCKGNCKNLKCGFRNYHSICIVPQEMKVRKKNQYFHKKERIYQKLIKI
jgi:hypothetical protein